MIFYWVGKSLASWLHKLLSSQLYQHVLQYYHSCFIITTSLCISLLIKDSSYQKKSQASYLMEVFCFQSSFLTNRKDDFFGIEAVHLDAIYAV